MTDSDDERKNSVTDKQNEPYRVGNKRPPMHSRFKKGVSGNLRGRPKRRPKFDEVLLKEFRKPVAAVQNGKPVKTSFDRLFATKLVKSGIMDGTAAARLLRSQITQAEIREAAAEKEAADRRQKEEKVEPEPFSWTEEQERLFRELEQLEMKRICKSAAGSEHQLADVSSDKSKEALPQDSKARFDTTVLPSPCKPRRKGNRDGT